ncbi:NYN domain-containing protein [Nocardia sp. NPDC050412]|uniref:NYN domain-containing protein n=1 Tax=Nocardia sp. NPDC050412 TaxID=3364320 RepID=UPI0037BBC0AD
MTDFSRIESSYRQCTLIVDGPNIEQSVARCWDRKPTRNERIQWPALKRWLHDLAAQRSAAAYSCVFTNTPANPPPQLLGWVRALVQDGWHVFAKPKANNGDGDIDADMLAHLSAHPWTTVVVVSHDAQCFARPLTELAAQGTEVIAIGMTEWAGCLPNIDGITFIDIDDIPALFEQAPPRMKLTALPDNGDWFHPVGDGDISYAA